MIEKAVNFTDSDMVTVPRRLKVRPENETTSLAYVTKDEEKLLKKNKPGTPHKGPEGVPNYNGGDVLTYTPRTDYSSTGYVGASQQQQQQQREESQNIRQQVVDTFNQQQGTNQQDTYTPPSQAYGPPPGQGRTMLNLLNMGFDPDSIKSMTAGLSPATMAFFGYTPGMTNMPTQLYQMLMEGSIVTPMEAMGSDESGIGTYSDLEAGAHPMFPGGLQQYYDDMSIPKFQSFGGGFGGGGGGFNYGYGSGGGGGSGFGYNMNMGMQGQPKQRGQVGPGSLQEQVNQAFLSGGKPFAKGGIVSLVED